MVAAFLADVAAHPIIIAESIPEETKLACFDKTREPILPKLVELLPSLSLRHYDSLSPHLQ